MTSAQVVETSVTNNSSSQNYTHPDDHTIRTTTFYVFVENSNPANEVWSKIEFLETFYEKTPFDTIKSLLEINKNH